MTDRSALTPRRRFLALLGLTGASALVSPATLLADDRGGLKPVNSTWDLSWTAKVKSAKYRAVFDSPTIGSAFPRASMWRSQYATVFGMEPAKLAAVVVVRHQAISMAMNDAFWDEFDLGRPAGRGGNGGGADNVMATPPASVPPVSNPSGDGARTSRGNPSSKGIAAFIAAGGIVLACDVAFGQMVAKYQGKDDARKQALDHLIPGVLVQPSGPFALMRAQDEGCNYMMGS